MPDALGFCTACQRVRYLAEVAGSYSTGVEFGTCTQCAREAAPALNEGEVLGSDRPLASPSLSAAGGEEGGGDQEEPRRSSFGPPPVATGSAPSAFSGDSAVARGAGFSTGKLAPLVLIAFSLWSYVTWVLGLGATP